MENPSVPNKTSAHCGVEDSSSPVPQRPTASGLVHWHIPGNVAAGSWMERRCLERSDHRLKDCASNRSENSNLRESGSTGRGLSDLISAVSICLATGRPNDFSWNALKTVLDGRP